MSFANTLWDGEFREKVGARVTLAGEPFHPYSVFNDPITAKSAVVIANYDEGKPVTVQASLDNGQPLLRYRRVEDPTWKRVADGIVIPPLSAVVVLG